MRAVLSEFGSRDAEMKCFNWYRLSLRSCLQLKPLVLMAGQICRECDCCRDAASDRCACNGGGFDSFEKFQLYLGI